MTLMLAMVTHAVAFSMDFSQSFASLRHRLNHPKVPFHHPSPGQYVEAFGSI